MQADEVDEILLKKISQKAKIPFVNQWNFL